MWSWWSAAGGPCLPDISSSDLSKGQQHICYERSPLFKRSPPDWPFIFLYCVHPELLTKTEILPRPAKWTPHVDLPFWPCSCCGGGLEKRIRPRGACHRERSRWSPAVLSLHSAHWGAPRRPGLSSVPPSLTRCQTWGGKSRAGTARRYHWRLNHIAVKSVTQEMLPASGTTWNSECQSCVREFQFTSYHFILLIFN